MCQKNNGEGGGEEEHRVEESVNGRALLATSRGNRKLIH